MFRRLCPLLVIAASACADGPAGPKYGFVEVMNSSANGFARTSFFATPDRCSTVRTIDHCVVRECGDDPLDVYAGLVTVSGTREAVSMNALVGGSYGTYQASALLFTGGETLTYAAAGDEVPAFSGSVIAPTQVTVTQPMVPALAPGDMYEIETAQDLSVSWTGANDSAVEVGFSDFTREQYVFCRYEANASSVSVPSAALKTIRTNLGWFFVRSLATTTVDAGDWSIDLGAGWEAAWPNGSPGIVEFR